MCAIAQSICGSCAFSRAADNAVLYARPLALLAVFRIHYFSIFLPGRVRLQLVTRNTFFSFAAVFDFFCSSLAPLAVQRAHFKPRAEVRCASSCAFPSIFHDVAILLLSGLEHETTDAVKASDCVLAVQALRLFASKHSDHVAAGTFSETSENFVRRRNKLVGGTYGQHVKRQP